MGLVFALSMGVAATQAPGLAPLPDSAPVHIAISLRVAHPEALEAFRRSQDDPNSSDYRRVLTPAEFGRRFGPSSQSYGKLAAWLREAGFTVTEFPNHILIEGTGTAGQVTKLLGVRLQTVEGQPASVHVPDGAPKFPAWLAPMVLHVSGLDTRVRYHHHLAQTLIGGRNFD